MESERNYIISFIKENRLKNRLTQETLAQKAGVGLRFIRDLEQGKATVQLDKLLQVLSLFGASLIPGRELNGFEIEKSSVGKHVRVSVRNGPVLEGLLHEAIYRDNKIYAWKLELTDTENLTNGKQHITLIHQDIGSIENL
ncbi:MAG: transcriptional regulator, y4mF family [Chitinophagaceae bacterium]|nr:transcriptional regulator, y4mF family [Chitinophagaceae bacterium]